MGMSEISYHEVAPGVTNVAVDGEVVGEIIKDEGGYYYRTNSGHEGKRFDTRREVFESIEG
jgi:hypothetical protein